jgi:hypothetical protein
MYGECHVFIRKRQRDLKNSNSTGSLLVLLPLLTFAPSLFPNIPNISDNMTNSSGLSSEQLERMEQLEQLVEETQQREEQREEEERQREEQARQKEEQERKERALLRQQQNYSTYEDPILGIQFEYPAWWEIRQDKDMISFDIIGDPTDPMYYNTTKTLARYNIANIQYFLPSLLKEMNTIERFMRQMMIELKSPYGLGTQNTSVNRTATIGFDNISAYKAESEDVFSDEIRIKNIRYFTIDNSTGTGYMISLNTNMDKLQEDAPLFERMVESFKILS